MISVSVSIDVPDLARGVRFYADGLGFSELARPYPGVVVLRGANVSINLLEKRAQSKPSPATEDVRHFDRHWTPVHLDFHVEDLKAALARAVDAGATAEQVFDHPEHGSAAFCADPFGNGFCLLQEKQRTAQI